MSARKLTLSHMARVVRDTRQAASNGSDGSTGVPTLGRDEMKLYSYYKPNLEAANYEIEVTQKILSGSQSLDVLNTRVADDSGQIDRQEFEVVVPRFTLDRNLINSYYPPDGHQDEGRILPHISFNDPHFPWEISPGGPPKLDRIIDSDRGLVPWVALLVFDPEELRLPDLPTIQNLNIPGYTTQEDVAKQNPHGTFPMTVNYYLSQIPKASRIKYEAGYPDPPNDEGFQELKSMTDAVNVIFPTKTLLGRLFSKNAGVAGAQEPDIEGYKFLAHVRNINTEGFPEAGVQEEGLFSIVVSSRTGTWNKPVPQTQICHLISIEHLDQTIIDWPRAPDDVNVPDRVGVISLFSWIYTSLPPNPINFITTMRNLTRHQQMLRADDQTVADLKAAASGASGSVKTEASRVLTDRLQMGYTISRWRTQTGEETAAFNRGPLVPIPMPPLSASGLPWPATLELPDSSNTSQDYQILDPETGLLDLSYSSAWQTGKLLAISDTVFSSALMRFRSTIHNSTASKTRMALNGMSEKKTLFQKIHHSVAILRDQSAGQTGDPERFRPAIVHRAVANLKTSPETLKAWKANVKTAVAFNTSAGNAVFDDFNLVGPNNNDWAIIHNWLSEKLLLGGIPPQHLLPEPSFLTAESLRFFYIDDFWLDCLIDGALSVANHLDSDDDVVRREIKRAYNTYLRTVVPDAGFKPQIPCYGFIIRSKLIKAMPDLRITVTWKPTNDPNPDKRHAVCRWTRWDDQTLMALLDRQPEELNDITLAQPQHQKRFALGEAIDYNPTTSKATVTFPLRQLYMKGLKPPPADGKWLPIQPTTLPSVTTPWLNQTTRGLEITKMAQSVNSILTADQTIYSEKVPNSVELGLELNDPCYYFQIMPRPPTSTISTTPQRDRQLYVRASSTAPPAPKTLAAPRSIAVTPNPHPRPEAPAHAAQSATHQLPRPPNQQLKIQPWPHSALAHDPHTALTTPTPHLSATATLQTRFDLTIFADYKGPPHRFPQDKYSPTDYLATNNIYFYDLIFSIRKKSLATASQYQLLKIVIDIPVASNPPDTHTEALLTPTYDGPGVRMLSNQRFIPFLFNDDPGKPLHVELVPRSTADDYAIVLNDRKTRELGFRLAEANVGPVVVTTLVDIDGQRERQPRGKVDITMTEWYATPAFPKGEAVASRFTVIKFATTDDVDAG